VLFIILTAVEVEACDIIRLVWY